MSMRASGSEPSSDYDAAEEDEFDAYSISDDDGGLDETLSSLAL